MKGKKCLRRQIVAILCVGLIIPQCVLAAGPMGAAPAILVSDVALGPQGTLAGQVVDSQGIGIPSTAVSVRQQAVEVAGAVTDPAGAFQVSGLRAGTYQIVSANSQGVFRLWTGNSAPPVARPRALIVAGGTSLRAQNGGLGQWVLPALAAGGIITGVAIATADDDDNNNGGNIPASP